ncbi:protein kinase [Lusitaniella coriacea LEGE 07157]|uniref:Protein kinase n=1 Tax=Lusitaniella coriacea LEGE 07157 TaxID=945747 RepID=A0A8J7IV68_9CYAN|nr:protein kinase [Lusitaniella coriacea]MBE9117028.1 protein kinase [Lusitaniella coriacea LEGE 07157]
MSYCINPHCSQPSDPANVDRPICHHCGSSLLLQNRYRVTQRLSDNSGFAIIYEVLDGSILKILKALKLQHNDNPKAVELFKQEALVLSQLDHPGIPKVEPNSYFCHYSRGLPSDGSLRDRAEPIHCFVMEKIDGPDLRQWLYQQGNMLIGERQALDWLKQMVEILHIVHQKNYFHRDIKLQNIMLRPTGQLVLIDFGAAREMTYTYLAQVGNAGNITKISSAGYTPPEQEKGHAVPQSDFYALGRTFAYLLTGKLLSDTDIRHPLTGEFRWHKYAPGISREFADFINCLMAPNAIDRPKDTQTILEGIDNLLATVDLVNRTEKNERRLDSSTNLGIDSPTLNDEVNSLNRPRALRQVARRGIVVGIALLLSIFGGYGGWTLYRNSGKGEISVEPIEVPQLSVERQPAKTLSGHASAIYDLAISPDGQLLASGSGDKTIKLWNLTTGKPIRTLTGHDGFVNHLLFSPDGNILISSSADKTLKIWDVVTGKLVRTLEGHDSFINVLLLSPDGRTLITASADDTLKIWDLETGKEKYTLFGHEGSVNTAALSSDGEILASGSADKTIKLWNLNTGEEIRTLEGHTSFINDLAIAPDGQLLASASADKTVKLWNLNTGEEIRTLEGHTSFINDLAIAPDGQLLASASADKTIKLWNLATGKLLRTQEGHTSYVNQLAISRDGETLVSGSADKTIRFWNLKTGTEEYVLTGYTHHIDYFSISPDRRIVVTGSSDNTIQLWEIEP